MKKKINLKECDEITYVDLMRFYEPQSCDCGCEDCMCCDDEDENEFMDISSDELQIEFISKWSILMMNLRQSRLHWTI